MIQLDDYVIDVLMRDLVGHDRRAVSFLVYLWFASEQGKEEGKEQRKANSVEASYRQIAESIGVSKSSVQSAVAWLIKRKLLASTKKTVTATPCYKVLTPWRDYESRSRSRA
jgi:predicted regulator of amino acid metabolism with ACT domain